MNGSARVRPRGLRRCVARGGRGLLHRRCRRAHTLRFFPFLSREGRGRGAGIAWRVVALDGLSQPRFPLSDRRARLATTRTEEKNTRRVSILPCGAVPLRLAAALAENGSGGGAAQGGNAGEEALCCARVRRGEERARPAVAVGSNPVFFSVARGASGAHARWHHPHHRDDATKCCPLEGPMAHASSHPPRRHTLHNRHLACVFLLGSPRRVHPSCLGAERKGTSVSCSSYS